MVIDFHTHIFPGEIRDNREKYFPSESAFRLLYDSRASKLVGADEIITMMDEQGVDKSVIFGFPWKKTKTFKMHNDYIVDATAKYPDRLIGLCCFDAYNDDAPDEAERCLGGGLSGIGELAFYESGIDERALDRLVPLMDICRERDKIILIHTNEPVGHVYPGKTPNTLNQIYKLVKQFPDNRIVLAHWGGGLFFFGLLKKEVKESFVNVYFDTAASPFLYNPEIYRIAKEIIGPDKILFGTDFPLLKPSRYFKDIKNSGLSEEDMEDICGENAKQLLGI
jgi:predicted TIM-barrel fold metal-dependent hydrolase